MTSIAFAVGVVRLGRRQCLVNELPAIEGLARVDVVCADKTGTLTENGMRVSRSRSDARRRASDGSSPTSWPSWPPTTPGRTPACRPSREAYKMPPGWTADRDRAVQVGHQVERRVLRRARQLGDRRARRAARPGVRRPPRKPSGSGRWDCGCCCSARVTVPVDDPDAPGTVTPVALVVLEQRVRPDARDTLDYFASQKVSVKVISGDNAVSVGAVAGSLGLRGRDDGCPPAARRSRTSWPTRSRSTRRSVGCGPTRSVPWCTPCSHAGTRSR